MAKYKIQYQNGKLVREFADLRAFMKFWQTGSLLETTELEQIYVDQHKPREDFTFTVNDSGRELSMVIKTEVQFFYHSPFLRAISDHTGKSIDILETLIEDAKATEVNPWRREYEEDLILPNFVLNSAVNSAVNSDDENTRFRYKKIFYDLICLTKKVATYPNNDAITKDNIDLHLQLALNAYNNKFDRRSNITRNPLYLALHGPVTSLITITNLIQSQKDQLLEILKDAKPRAIVKFLQAMSTQGNGIVSLLNDGELATVIFDGLKAEDFEKVQAGSLNDLRLRFYVAAQAHRIYTGFAINAREKVRTLREYATGLGATPQEMMDALGKRRISWFFNPSEPVKSIADMPSELKSKYTSQQK